METLTRSFIAIAMTLGLSTASIAKVENSCNFISSNAFNNRAECIFTDTNHTTVLITPFRKISTKTAADWIVSASIALQIGGEHNFESITVATSPDYSGDFAEAKTDKSFSLLRDTEKIKLHTMICRRSNNWDDVIGPDGKASSPPKCKPLKP